MTMTEGAITKNFYVKELRVSAQHSELAQKIEITPLIFNTAKLLLESCWQPVRDRFGLINVNSFVRSPELNALVGGTENSDHLIGAAMDGTPKESTCFEVFKWIAKNKLPYRQVIYYVEFDFIHMSINTPGKKFKNEAFLLRQKEKIYY